MFVLGSKCLCVCVFCFLHKTHIPKTHTGVYIPSVPEESVDGCGQVVVFTCNWDNTANTHECGGGYVHQMYDALLCFAEKCTEKCT